MAISIEPNEIWPPVRNLENLIMTCADGNVDKIYLLKVLDEKNFPRQSICKFSLSVLANLYYW